MTGGDGELTALSAAYRASAEYAALSHQDEVGAECLQDIEDHLRHALRGLQADAEAGFAEYLTWCDCRYDMLALDPRDLRLVLQSIRDFLSRAHGAELDIDSRFQFDPDLPLPGQIVCFHYRLFEGEDHACLPEGQERCTQDVQLMLDALNNDKVDFDHLVQWHVQMLSILHIDVQSVRRMLGSMGAALRQRGSSQLDRVRSAFLMLNGGGGDSPATDSLHGSLLEHTGALARQVFDFHDSVFRLSDTPLYIEKPDCSEKCIEDIANHFSYLGQAALADSRELFQDYVEWVSTVLENVNVDKMALIQCFVSMQVILRHHPGIDEMDFAGSVLIETVSDLLRRKPERKSFIEAGSPHSKEVSEYLQLLLQGKRKQAMQHIMGLQQSGLSIRDIYIDIFQRAQYEIGRLWQLNRISVADEHYCTATTQMIMSQLYPYLMSKNTRHGTFVAACVGSELHEIGMRMVADFMEMEGWETFYLGANTPVEAIVAACLERNARVLGLSTTITTQVKKLRNIITEIRRTEALADLAILVGGYPFLVDPELYRAVGADGFARSAEEVHEVACSITGTSA